MHPEEVEVHFNEKRGLLSLSCGTDAFGRIRDFVVQDARLADLADKQIGEIEVFEVGSAPAQNGLRAWTSAIGCVVAGGLIAVIFAVGLVSIGRALARLW